MKHFKMLGLVVVAAAVLMAFVGVGTASATTLTSPEGSVVKTGTVLRMVSESKATLTTSFKNIECTEVTIEGKTTNESGESIGGNVESLTWGGCNCEVKTISGGTFTMMSVGDGDGIYFSTNKEITANCSTIFGTVHCIYKTSNTAFGVLTGSGNTKSTATLDVEAQNIPRLTTNGLCSEKADLDAKFKIVSPDPMYID